MKARPIPLSDLSDSQQAVRHILSVRFAEVLALSGALQNERAPELHDLRIACKRARYCIERFSESIGLRRAEKLFAALQDELGTVHDCDVLAEIVQQCDARAVGERVRRDRARHLSRAKRLWKRGFEQRGAFMEIAAYTGMDA